MAKNSNQNKAQNKAQNKSQNKAQNKANSLQENSKTSGFLQEDSYSSKAMDSTSNNDSEY